MSLYHPSNRKSQDKYEQALILPEYQIFFGV